MNSLIYSTLRPALLLRSGQPGGNIVGVCRQFRVAVVAMMEETKTTHYVRVRPVENDIDITFSFPPQHNEPPSSSTSATSTSAANKLQIRNFKRPSSEPLSVSLNKIAHSLSK